MADGEHQVSLFFKLTDDDLGDGEIDDSLYALEERLLAVFERNEGLGTYDFHEWGGGFFHVFMYGSDAEAITRAIMEEVLRFDAPPGSFLVKRFGPLGSREEKMTLGESYLSRSQ